MTTPHPVSDAARALFAETPIHAMLEKFLLPVELDIAWTDAVREPTGQQLFEKLLEGLGVDANAPRATCIVFPGAARWSRSRIIRSAWWRA